MKDNKTHMFFGIALLLVVLATFALVYTQYQKPITITQAGPGGEGIPKITASGDAELNVMPDEAIMRIRVETKGQTAQATQDENSRIMTSVQSALKRAGIASKDIETDQYNLYPWTEWDPDEHKQRDMGFRVYHTIKVKTTDLDKVGDFIGAAVDAGATNVEGVTFGLSEKQKQEVRKVALQDAANNAKMKAQTMADGLGVSLGELLAVQESSFNYGGIYRAEMDMMTMKAGGMPEAAPPIEPEQVRISATVSVSYRIK
jgi:hypothetical protein